ncbi:MAG: hypothetical protein IJZ42_13130 [Lachnospiraceae bacterium]|nr:hypothetical protein [Lachnospiraceae bacterium]
MREILFRGKRIDNGGWIKGSLWNHLGAIKILSAGNVVGHDVDPKTVGQFTGLTDKNGTKIFEGDIVKGAWDTIFQVVYDDCYLGFRAKEEDGMHNCIDYYGLDRIEVVGNIHDSPELSDC